MVQKKIETYPKWVGIIPGLILNGSAHFLSGQRMAGVKWYLGITACAAGMWIAVIPGTLSYVVGFLCFLAGIITWLIMLKQSYRPVRRIGVKGWVIIVLIAIFLNSTTNWIQHQFVQINQIPDSAMAPTMMPGDHVVVNNSRYWLGSPQRGDIVIFTAESISNKMINPDAVYCKRVVGLPGEWVEIKKPHLLINGKMATQPDIFKEIAAATNGYHGYGLPVVPEQTDYFLFESGNPVLLGEDEYFVLGDNSQTSFDSRYFGPIKGERIVGKVTRIYYPFSRINALK